VENKNVKNNIIIKNKFHPSSKLYYKQLKEDETAEGIFIFVNKKKLLKII